MSERVIVERVGAVAHVQLNRPEKHNGLDAEQLDALVEIGDEMRSDNSVRAIVLSGRGKSFCAGLDFQSVMATPDALVRFLERGDDSPANLAQRVAWVWQEVPVPVIAAVHGAVFGGGLQIALAADLRYARADAQLSVMEIRWGLIPDMSITQTLPRLCGLDVAKELTFTGRTLSGDEALRHGLVTRVCEDPVAEALTTAEEIAARNPHAIRNAKELFSRAPLMSVRDALRLETTLQRELLGSPNQMEAVMANFQKRPPKFDDPS